MFTSLDDGCPECGCAVEDAGVDLHWHYYQCVGCGRTMALLRARSWARPNEIDDLATDPDYRRVFGTPEVGVSESVMRERQRRREYYYTHKAQEDANTRRWQRAHPERLEAYNERKREERKREANR